MSWDSYINNMLMNYQSAAGNVANNVLTEAYILAQANGAVCASNVNGKKVNSIDQAEFKTIQDFFKNKSGTVTLNKKKFFRKKLLNLHF